MGNEEQIQNEQIQKGFFKVSYTRYDIFVVFCN